MTWAVYTLYAYDTYPRVVFDWVIENQMEFMVSRRGFTRFREFNKALLSLYTQKKEGADRLVSCYHQLDGVN